MPVELTWQELALGKKLAVLELIPLEWRLPQPIPTAKSQKDVTGAYVQQYLEDWEIEITESDAVRIVEQTSSGNWTVTKVVTAFCHRAALAHQLTNCLHEIFFDQAIADAKLLDEKFASGAGPVGPLYGLPVSFKDQFHVHGVETTMGYVGWIDTFEGIKGTGKEKTTESELVREIRLLGGVPFCKTSLPHTVMSMETWNHIVGSTLNPHNRLMSTGGSSGGEGALIAMRGSPIGFGTDIGGSIRIPAAFNGLFGIRPSFGRLPYVGAANSMPGQNTIPSVCGPLAPTARSIKLMMQAALTQEPWLHDPAVVEMPWREELAKLSTDQKLTFGLYSSDGDVNPLPPVKRAMEKMKALILEMGHEIIEWNPPSHARAYKLAFEAFTSDGGIDIHHHIGLSGETLQPRIEEFYGKKAVPAKTVDALHRINLDVAAYRKEYMDYWNSTSALTKTGKPVDAILAPVAPFPALEFGKSAIVAYTPWVNTLDYTAVVVPVTTTDSTIDKFETEYTPLNDSDRIVWEEYDPEASNGTPVAVQLVGRRLQEEKMIALAELFESALASK
ncbi:acetamidase [Microthyrium microscopicum]|uniref:amidase n=1 Tax=Microthyrium microscopicum TaxID=703497 RepID=A0A6A6U4D7_9PEZI|nr:acetamidase [Microthyrium microscopicum]